MVVKTAAEDTDDDDDGVSDGSDSCPKGNLGWISTSTTDSDGDGCQDSTGEDTDDDNDGIADGTDNCRFVWNPTQTDYDGDNQVTLVILMTTMMESVIGTIDARGTPLRRIGFLP